jgi:ribulose-phosphate 3-epimerase
VGKLSASILSADLGNLADQVKLVHRHADVIHVDVMDAHFASPLTIGPVVVASLRPHTDRILHGHLMAEAPATLFDELAEAGMDLVSIHVEAVEDPAPVIAKARGAGLEAGLAVSPRTPIDTVLPHLEEVVDVIVMSVEPGSAERALVPETLPKLDGLRREVQRRGLSVDVEIEGGVTLEGARRFVDAGATVLVAGSAIFAAGDVEAAAQRLKSIVEAA